MHLNIYLTVEYRANPRRQWTFLARLPDLGAVATLAALLGFGAVRSVPETHTFTLRGLPHDVADDSIREDAFTIDDAAAASDLGELLDDVRFCTREDAETWAASGASRIFSGGHRVTDPECVGGSYLTLPEFERLVALLATERPGPVLRALLASMTSLQAEGFDTRVVYWASG